MTATVGTARAGEQDCPACGERVPVEERFVTWCDACGWNVDPAAAHAEPRRSRTEALRRRAARHHGEQLLAELSRGGAEPRADGGPAMLARLLAAAVHGLTVALTACALYLIVAGWSTVTQPLLGGILLALAVVLRPRFGKLDKDLPVLHRADAPALFALLDEVAAAAGTSGVHAVVVGPEANAGVTAYGVRQRRVLHLGLGLWEILSPQGRVALLGHEFGHYAHGDTRHLLLVGSALRSLHTWRYMLAPNSADTLAEVAANVLTAPPRWTVEGVTILLDHLTLRASQRSEYLADTTAARTGGAPAAVELLDRLLVADGVEGELHRESVAARTRIGGTRRDDAADGLWGRLAEWAENVPAREYERLRRVGELRGHRVDSTHPPTHLRRRLLAEGEAFPARVTVNAATTTAIDGELAGMRRQVARDVVTGAHHG
ncbi:M48 family metalloprotease [Streptomyces sp. NPDC006460]|uniref:M48 family metalloprotease n=1 Tax=Streptomyces sp. NPDC006460 TaxID=3154304 RepID=UPI0033B1E53D